MGLAGFLAVILRGGRALLLVPLAGLVGNTGSRLHGGSPRPRSETFVVAPAKPFRAKGLHRVDSDLLAQS